MGVPTGAIRLAFPGRPQRRPDALRHILPGGGRRAAKTSTNCLPQPGLRDRLGALGLAPDAGGSAPGFLPEQGSLSLTECDAMADFGTEPGGRGNETRRGGPGRSRIPRLIHETSPSPNGTKDGAGNSCTGTDHSHFEMTGRCTMWTWDRPTGRSFLAALAALTFLGLAEPASIWARPIPNICTYPCSCCHGGSGFGGSASITTVPPSSVTSSSTLTTPASGATQASTLTTPARSTKTGTARVTTVPHTSPHTQQAHLTRPAPRTIPVSRARPTFLGGFMSGNVALMRATAMTGLYARYLGAALGAAPIPYADPYTPGPVATSDPVGTADNYLVSPQQAGTIRELVRQHRLDTRRHLFDEWLYERKNAPTWEDDRDWYQGEELRRSRNDPPINEIVSARALNALLDHLQKLQAAGAAGSDVPVEDDVVIHLNVTSGRGGHLGLLKDGGQLHWPLILTGDDVKPERNQLNSLIAEAVAQAPSHALNADTAAALGQAADRLRQYLADQARNLPAGQYLDAKRFLDDLGEALRALQQPDAADFLSRKYAARGKTAGEVVQSMTRQGLHFAPATSGDEPAYLALHRALVTYLDAIQSVAQR